MGLARHDLVQAVQTLTSEGEAPTADRVATHLALTGKDAEHNTEEVQDALTELVRRGQLRSWRVFAATGDYHTDANWLIAYTPAG